MEWFRLEIVLPSADSLSSPEPAVRGACYLSDMVQRAIEYLEWNSSSRVILDVEINLADVHQQVDGVGHVVGWSVKS
jgi:hypothetical protein